MQILIESSLALLVTTGYILVCATAVLLCVLLWQDIKYSRQKRNLSNIAQDKDNATAQYNANIKAHHNAKITVVRKKQREAKLMCHKLLKVSK